MEYEELLKVADSNGLITKEKALRGAKGRIKNNRIAIRNKLSTTEKACVLAEELGHYHTTTGNILDQSSTTNRKQERKARLWAYNEMIGLTGIIHAYQHGCTDRTSMANYLDVTEEFLQEALTCYMDKYGQYKETDNYILFFQPLGVLELYK